MKGTIPAVIISTDTNAYYNLAVERLLLNASLGAPRLFLWQSKNAVVIGAHQNPYAECDLLKMQKEGVQLTRRISGGGAVYHDLGNLNFCFVCPKGIYDEKAQTKLIASALSKQGVKVEISGRNDLTVNGFKISGNAYYRSKQNGLHHGTLLISSNLNKLSAYLTPSNEKLQKSGVKSVKSRVANLKTFNPEISIESAKKSIVNEFCFTFNGAEELSIEQLFTNLQIEEQIRLISSKEYLFARWANQNQIISKCFDWGICYFEQEIHNGKQALSINTDSLYPNVISTVKGEYADGNLGASDPCAFESIKEYEAYRELIEFLREEL